MPEMEIMMMIPAFLQGCVQVIVINVHIIMKRRRLKTKMTETCKYCKKTMKLIDESEDDGYRKYTYRCENEDCNVMPRLIYNVCENCENEHSYWVE